MTTLFRNLALLIAGLTLLISPLVTAQSAAPARVSKYRGAFFEVKYPSNFTARSLDATKARESSAATFSAPDSSMEFYIFSPQWAGDAPGIALVPAKETEVARKSEKGKSSGVEGTFTWTTIAAKDKSYTRLYQSFLAEDKSINWVIGMKYSSEEALAAYRAQYAQFKASLVQLAD
jgi:hypothetical protein